MHSNTVLSHQAQASSLSHCCPCCTTPSAPPCPCSSFAVAAVLPNAAHVATSSVSPSSPARASNPGRSSQATGSSFAQPVAAGFPKSFAVAAALSHHFSLLGEVSLTYGLEHSYELSHSLSN
ncbi:hypothetical protein M0R45_019363 [Rubus argutus]|uniref:Uncharacterized protein n=1 Tax=Rubus argutus TaxID=59490 RepID=A0AAW1X7Y5_RUBAR